MAVHDRKTPKSHGVIPGEFWSGPTLEELARMQNVRPVERLEEVIGGWPAEELQDGFEKELARWRQEGASQELRRAPLRRHDELGVGPDHVEKRASHLPGRCLDRGDRCPARTAAGDSQPQALSVHRRT